MTDSCGRGLRLEAAVASVCLWVHTAKVAVQAT